MGSVLIFLLGMFTGMCGAASLVVGIRRREWWPIIIGGVLMLVGAQLLS